MFDDTIPRTTYVSRHLPLAPARAARGFAALCRGLADRPGHGALEILEPTPRTISALREPSVRVVRGRLRVRRWRIVAVEVELTPWSRSASELGLRPLARAGVGQRLCRSPAYFAVAHDVLGHVADLLLLDAVDLGPQVRDAALRSPHAA